VPLAEDLPPVIAARPHYSSPEIKSHVTLEQGHVDFVNQEVGVVYVGKLDPAQSKAAIAKQRAWLSDTKDELNHSLMVLRGYVPAPWQ
jgi:hypothetical protein